MYDGINVKQSTQAMEDWEIKDDWDQDFTSSFRRDPTMLDRSCGR